MIEPERVSERGFASDNAAGVHPEVLAAIAAANHGHAFGYGHDPLTERVHERLRAEFGADAHPFLVWGGSGANVLCLRAACRPWEAVICPETAHINIDEAGAPEAIAGVKLVHVATPDGKLRAEQIEPLLARAGDEHAVQPRVVSVSQATELGTVYSADELRALADAAHAHGLLLHVDGARLGNAAAALGVPWRAITTDVGADLVSVGGTKNGLLGAEVAVVLRPELAAGMPYLRKQTLQLASKMRFLAAQFEALLDGELWRRSAAQANDMAARLAAAVGRLPGVEIVYPVESNAVFARLPADARAALHDHFDFYDWDAAEGIVRWMCAWDTTEADVDAFAAAVAGAVAAGSLI